MRESASPHTAGWRTGWHLSLVPISIALALIPSDAAIAQQMKSSIQGELTSSNGESVVGLVQLQRFGSTDKVIAQTDSTGNFTFSSLAPGNYMISVTAEGYRVDRITPTSRNGLVSVPADGKVQLTIRLY